MKRRLIRFLLVLIAGLLFFAVSRVFDIALMSSAHLSGWVLFGTVVFLMLLSMRKRIRFFPIGSAELWLQFHIYVGFLSGLLFLQHIGWSMPNGTLEIILAIVFSVTFLSGVFGIVMSRILARRLTTQGHETLYQHIGPKIDEINEEIKAAVLASTEQSASSAIAQFYSKELHSFLVGPRNFLPHVLQVERPLQNMLKKISGFERYLSADERQTMQLIATKVREKNALDYQYALQSTLKIWLFVHVPMTYSLLVFAVTHGALVISYTGVVLS